MSSSVVRKVHTKVILITGATSGIGLALAAAAVGEGHRVVLNFRSNPKKADDVVTRLRTGVGEVQAIQADVSEADQVAHLIDQTLDRFGSLDCVINNAGVGRVVPLDRLDAATFGKTLNDNLLSAFLISQASWPHMKQRGGRLIFLSSGAARTGGGLSAAYAASKGGTEGLMHAYATALRPHRITANAIAPTLIDSKMARAMLTGPSSDLPMGRLGRPKEVWPVVRMMLDTEYLTGQTVHVDAGRYMT